MRGVETSINHRFRAGDQLFGRLPDKDHGARPISLESDHRLRHAEHPRDVGVMAAHVADRHFNAIATLDTHLAGIGQTSRFLDGICIHVGSVHDRWSWTVAKDAHNARLADAGLDLETQR